MIDVAISSCARVDVLEKSVHSFIKHVKSKEGFRLVICEDKVKDKYRRKEGLVWLQANKDLFNNIIYADKYLTYVYCFSEILKYINSSYFFRLEDDVVFHESIDVDSIIDFMKEQPIISQVIFKRKKHIVRSSININNSTGRNIDLADFYSIATGLFNLDLTRKIVGLSGTEQCHESSVLTPSMVKLGLKSSVIEGVRAKHALDCVGDSLGYIKGSWKGK